MIFDTDILIWIERNNPSARDMVNDSEERFISAQTYLELLQYAENKDHVLKSEKFLKQLEFKVLPITENVSHIAMTYMREYGLSHGLDAGDCLIAATTVEHNQPLATGNAKHFRAIKGLELKIFRP